MFSSQINSSSNSNFGNVVILIKTEVIRVNKIKLIWSQTNLYNNNKLIFDTATDATLVEQQHDVYQLHSCLLKVWRISLLNTQYG